MILLRCISALIFLLSCFFIWQVFSSTWETVKFIQKNTREYTAEVQVPGINEPEIKVFNANFDYVFQRPSYISGTWWTYNCNREECKLNLKLIQIGSQKNLSSKLSCNIDFWFETDQSTRCNPNTVILPRWEHSIIITVFEKNNPDNFTQKNIKIIHGFSENKSELSYIGVQNQEVITESKKSDNSVVENKIPEKRYLRWNIIIQSKTSKSREIVWSKIVCRNVKKCNINLDSFIDTNNKLDDISYYWDFWNGERSTKKNPSWVWLLPGEYTITLNIRDKFGNEVRDSVSMFIYETQIEKIFDPLNYRWLKITGILVNSKWRDDAEWIEISNTSNQNMSLQWLVIDDIQWRGSKWYVIQEDTILLAGSSRKFYKTETNLSLWNSNDQVNIYVWDSVIDTHSWDFSVPENFVLLQDSLDFGKQNVKVIRVIDGDTIQVKFPDVTIWKVRFIWVDTPETKHPFKPLEEF